MGSDYRKIMEKGGDNFVIPLKRSRKAFIIEYSCGFFLLGIAALIYYSGMSISEFFQYVVTGAGVIAIVSAEFLRLLTRYKITPDKFVVIKGIITQHKKNVHFHPLGFVPDINLKQGRIQRILNYGTIFVMGSGENSIELNDINRPKKVMEIIEELIDKNRTPSTKRGDA